MIDLLVVGGTSLLVSGISYLLTKLPRLPSKLDEWAQISTIIAGLTGLLTIGFGVYTYSGSLQAQREVNAVSLYREHLQLSMESPELAAALCEPSSDSTGVRQRREYEWFVAHGLHSFETILSALPNDAEWVSTLREFVRIHRSYFQSDQFDEGHYGDQIRIVVNSELRSAPRQPSATETINSSCLHQNAKPPSSDQMLQSPGK